MITAKGVDVRAGARLLLHDVSLTIAPGDRVGLVGRNGAGKTTLAGILAGVGTPAAGSVVNTGSVGYLPQDPRAADPAHTVMERILSGRGLDEAVRALRAGEAAMAAAATGGSGSGSGSGSETRADTASAGPDFAAEPGELDRAMRRYARADAAFQAAGGYQAEAEAARVAVGMGLPQDSLHRALGTLSGGQRRRVELARILFAGHDTLLLDEPTNHLDADSVAWLRTFLLGHTGALVLISHDVDLVTDVVNRVFHLDPLRAAVDVHNTGWTEYLRQREADDRRRKRERANAENKAAVLHAQAEKMKARSSTAVTARSMARRADRMLAELEPERRTEKRGRLRLPEPQPCGRIPLGAISLSKSYGQRPVLSGVDLAVERGSRMVVLGPNGAGKTTLLRILAGVQAPDSGRVVPGHGLRLGYFAQEHETLDPARSVEQNLRAAAPRLSDGEARSLLGSFLFTGDDAGKPAGVLSGGEKTRLALAALVSSGANVLLLDEPTNNLDLASKAEILAALSGYPGAVVMVSHDEEAVQVLRPQRVLMLPEAFEDYWNAGYGDLVGLA